ncbi:siderophore ABC transporter substrate-binding protein [Alysiella filiformis]|nr:siderophore ABC transporter substrate-binding protein [Alysiella filiformis]
MKPHDNIQGEVIKVKTARGEFPVPKNPERIAVYDFGMIDTLAALGVNIGATVDNTRLEYIKPVVEKAEHVGTLFEPNYEKLNAFKPQLIITGSRANKAIHQLNEIAPTIEMTADTKDMLNSAKERIDAFAQIFGKQAEADKLKADIDKAFADAKAAAQGKGTGLVLIVNGGKLSAQSPKSRLGGWLHQDIGIAPVDTAMKEGSHGMPASFEYVKEKNPDWLFVLDRGAAIGEEGQAAKDVLNNPLIAETTAWKKGQVVYLDSGVYVAAGGARQLVTAANQVTEAMKNAK